MNAPLIKTTGKSYSPITESVLKVSSSSAPSQGKPTRSTPSVSIASQILREPALWTPPNDANRGR